MSEATTFAALAGRFDAFLLDQFGVLVDGPRPYPFARRTLAALAERGKTVLILSNSGKRSAANVARLEALGFDRATFDTVLSSGEVAHAHLAREIGRALPEGPRVLLIARDGDASAIKGLGACRTGDPAEADLVLIAGSEGDVLPLAHYRRLLAPAAARRVPCLNTNPDMVMLTAGGPAFGAGRIAALYEELGGTVERIGKPFPAIYRAALERVPSGARVLAVGDSPAHDIRGGRAAGLATALVCTGIHAGLGAAERAALCQEEDGVPDYIIPSLEL